MNILSHRPNILFMVWVRNKQINVILNLKLRRQLYYTKIIKALTTIETGIYLNQGHFKLWKINGKEHRDDGPACIYGISNEKPNGTDHYYYKHGKRHRDDGPAWIQGISTENPNGTDHYYYKHGKRHRDDGPAWIHGISKENPNGTKHIYYQHGERHRDDGPAYIGGISTEKPNGTRHSYYKNGIEVYSF